MGAQVETCPRDDHLAVRACGDPLLVVQGDAFVVGDHVRLAPGHAAIVGDADRNAAGRADAAEDQVRVVRGPVLAEGHCRIACSVDTFELTLAAGFSGQPRHDRVDPVRPAVDARVRAARGIVERREVAADAVVVRCRDQVVGVRRIDCDGRLVLRRPAAEVREAAVVDCVIDDHVDVRRRRVRVDGVELRRTAESRRRDGRVERLHVLALRPGRVDRRPKLPDGARRCDRRWRKCDQGYDHQREPKPDTP